MTDIEENHFEYVDPLGLFRRIHQWLSSAGICPVVTRAPTIGASAVMATCYQSLQRLAGRMSQRTADEVSRCSTTSEVVSGLANRRPQLLNALPAK
jgi:hypothetical protein